MLKNNLILQNDGTNVYATLFVKSKRIGRIILIIINSLLLGLLVFFVSSLQQEEIATFLFPLIIFGIIIIVFPIRYLIWNTYGKEHLVINTKSISYSHDYGIFQTNLKTIMHRRFGTAYESVRTSETEDLGRLIFVRYNDDTDLPEEIYQTTVLLPIENIKKIEESISDLYSQKLTDDFNFYPNSLN